MKVYGSILTALFVACIKVTGQFSPVYSSYMMNGLAINPAYAGSHEVLSLSFLHRSQWSGFEGAPKNDIISAHAQVKDKNVGLGLMFLHEGIGITNGTGIYGNYAYRINLGKGKIALGLKAGIDIMSYSESGLRLSDTDDSEFGLNVSSVLPNFGAGIFYHSPEFYVGFSVPYFLSRRESESKEGFEVYHEMANYNYLVTSGVLLNLSKKVKLKPSFLLQYNQKSPFVLDLSTTVVYRDLVWLGVTYRNENAIAGIAEVRLYPIMPQLKIGYAYDYSLGKLANFGSGSHEIVLSYEFSYTIKASNPRYF